MNRNSDLTFHYIGSARGTYPFNSILCCTKTTGPLLIHLSPRRNAVYPHEQQLARAHNAEQAVDVVEHGQKHLILRCGSRLHEDQQNVA